MMNNLEFLGFWNFHTVPSPNSTKTKLFVLIMLTSFFWITRVRAEGQEITRRRTRNVCQEHKDCPINSFCEKSILAANGQCICNQGYIIIDENGERKCYKAAERLGDSCLHNEQCMITLSTESICKNNRCQCQDGTHYVERKNTCYKSVRIGEYCTFSNNCLGDDTVCRSGICRCPFGSHPNFFLTNCIRDVTLGEKCYSDEECLPQNSRCSGVCKCRDGYIKNSDSDKCLRVPVRMYESCEENEQCTEVLPFTKCSEVDRKCVCKEGFYDANFKCIVTVELNGICEINENCVPTENSICQNGRCVCPPTLYPKDGICSSVPNQTSSQRLFFIIFFLIYLMY